MSDNGVEVWGCGAGWDPQRLVVGVRGVYAALEATQGQLDILFCQLSYKCHIEVVAFVGD